MFTVKKAMNKEGFVISVGDRHPTYAETAEQVAEAVKHYWGNHDNHDESICPFCLQISKR